MNRTLLFLCFVTCGALLVIFPGQAAPQSSSNIPVMDGGAGPCSVQLTVLGVDSKPVYDATVKVHIAYGFAGAHRLDLQAGTNADGKVKFTGLPSRVHRPPLEFQASKGDLQATLDYDPVAECTANHEISLQKSKPAESQ